ncbi:family 43 glycosylhydrolase [Sphingobium tyrosinilyticum]|uniref:Family 43 glycosylhydrolase n=1 Tax=Sphingobium tyrosinilyticum TaxID=2715436 RepID=A0ABV9F3V9_9SPHN
MSHASRREALAFGLGVTAASALPTGALAASALPRRSEAAKLWPRGIEGQRKADLGNGTYLNPVLAGDHPDPSVLKDGDTYYKVSSSFHYYPGLVIWKSTDLVNWTPVGPALRRPVGSVFAPDLIKHDGRYYIYFPAANFAPSSALPPAEKAKRPIMAIYVVHSDRIDGPWSDPMDMGIYEGIDPGHVVGEDGTRYLFLDGGKLIPITDDGLKRAGKTAKVYSGWPIPEDWIVEGFALEGPKLLKKDGWFYMFSAQGGTAGPPTSHMAVVARSRSVRGPWENCPHNPIVHTQSADEPWWSRGHATPVQGPAGDWWFLYHGYENGFRTLGRQMLLEPFDWTADGWPLAKGGDLTKPLRKPRGGKAGAHGAAHSDDFTRDRFGINLAAFMPGDTYAERMRLEDGALILTGEGTRISESSPLVINAGERNYEMSVEVELTGNAQGGILLYYDQRFFCGAGADGQRLRTYKMGQSPMFGDMKVPAGRRLFLRVVNHENVATFFHSQDARHWQTYISYEVAGYNHNVADGFLSLRPALYAIKDGTVRFRNLRYVALN